MKSLGKACIIGAGPNGLSMAKRLRDHNISYDHFDASDEVGGNWYYQNPNNMSACYKSLHIDTSKWRLAYEDFPVPEHWPDFPHHSLLKQYLMDYTKHFGLYDSIKFKTKVTSAVQTDTHKWSVSTDNGQTSQYDWLIVANGHHWDPFTPSEYGNDFQGVSVHSHTYDTPYDPIDMRDKNILIVGVGNSAMDISSELSQRHIANKCFVSTRRGCWVLPKYLNGQPADKISAPSWMPAKLGRYLARKIIRKHVGKMSDYGLPDPDHEPLDAHPSVSGEFLTRVGSGDINIKPGIEKLTSNGVKFVDSTHEQIDIIIWATGYNIAFPFFKDPQLQVKADNSFPLYRRMIKPGFSNLFFIGLAQPLPTLVNFGEQQSKYVAQVMQGKHELPDRQAMQNQITKDEQKYLGHYYKAKRHTIQVDFDTYVADLKKEIGTAWHQEK